MSDAAAQTALGPMIVGPAEYAARYLRPAGRDDTVSEIERAVYVPRADGAK